MKIYVVSIVQQGLNPSHWTGSTTLRIGDLSTVIVGLSETAWIVLSLEV